jgi:hypothetical protein
MQMPPLKDRSILEQPSVFRWLFFYARRFWEGKAA